MEKQGTMDTIWEVSDDLWEKIEPLLLAADPPKATGRKRADQRQMFNGIIFRLRSGCQWNHLPKELGDDSTLHRTFQRWVALGVFAQMWAMLVEECKELGGVEWGWQAADAAMGKARFGGAKLAPIPQTEGKLVPILLGRTPSGRARWSVECGDCWGQRPRYQATGSDP